MEQVNSKHRSESDQELLSANTIFVGSSRLPQKLDTIPEFFSALLKLAADLDPDRDALVTAEGTACDKFVRRVGDLFGVRVAVMKKPAEGCADAVLASVADQMTVLSLRKNGNLHQAVAQRLEAGKKTRILIEPSLVKKSLSKELLSHGATGWYLMQREAPLSTLSQSRIVSRDSGTESPAALRVKDVDSERYLLHWTRRRVGPWPDQTDQDFIDDLLFGSSRKDHREVAALRRILATGKILASNGLTRDPRPVVCFSDISFEQLLERRVFRPHLSRWDFEPFGIAIDKAWLKNSGAVAVRYGDEMLWESMSESERPFFQLNRSESKVDWSIENEWRIVGDVDLKCVPPDAAVVFVPTLEHAAEVDEFSRWPVVVLDEGNVTEELKNESAN